MDVSAHAADTSIHNLAANKVYLDTINQNLGTANVPAFAGLTVTGDIAVAGKVDGVDVSAHAADSAIHHTHTNKTNLDTCKSEAGNGKRPAFAGLTVNGDVAVTGKVDGVDVSVHAADTTIHHAHTNKGNLDSVDQNLGTANAPAFAGMTVNGNVAVTGTVDGVDVSAHAANSAIHHTHANKTNLDAVNQNVSSAGTPAFAGLTVNGDVAVTGKVDGVDVSAHATRHQSGGADALTGSLDANARIQVKVSDILVGIRRALNLISGDNIVLAVLDDAANESVDVTISAVGVTSTKQGPETVTGVAGEAMVAYDLCYLGSDGKYYRTNSLSPATMPGLVLAGADLRADQEGSFIRRGQVTNSNWSWPTVGGFLYACDTPGFITQFRPDISGEQQQILGIAKSATEIDFEPQLILMEVA